MECPVCFSQLVSPVSAYTGPGFAFLRCNGCGVLFASPMKAAAKEWYEQHGHYCAPDQPKENKPFYEGQFLKDAVHQGKNRLLAIGCGYNLFLKKLSDAGYDVTAIDFNENVIDFTRTTCGISKAYCCSIEDFISAARDMFDIVVFFEVLEHLEQPGRFLRSLSSILAPGGYIALSMPNRLRFVPQSHWADYPPHHLTRWDKKSLEKNLAQCGFIVRRCMISPVSAEQLMYAWNFFFWTEGRLRSAALKENASFFTRAAYRALLKTRVVFYNLAAAMVQPFFFGKGTYLYTVAQRKP